MTSRRRVQLARSEPLEPRRLLSDAGTATPLAAGSLVPGIEFDGSLYCSRAGPTGTEVWRTDGTAAGTVLLQSTTATAPAANFTVFDGSVAYSIGTAIYDVTPVPGSAHLLATSSDPGPGFPRDTGPLVSLGTRLAYQSDFNTLSTDDLGDVEYLGGDAGFAPGPGIAAEQTTPTTIGGVTYFIDQFANLGAVVATDGTGAASEYASESAAAAAGLGNITAETLGTAGGQVVFTALDGNGTGGLFAIASPYAAPTLVRTFDDGAYIGVTGRTVGDDFYFETADDGTGAAPQLWRTDGTAAGTYAVSAPLPATAAATAFTAVAARLVFAEGDAASDTSTLWSSDGTAAGTAAAATVPGTVSAIYAGTDGTAYVATTAGTVAAPTSTLYSLAPGGTTAVPLFTAPSGQAVGDVVPVAGGVYFATVAATTGTSLPPAGLSGWFAPAGVADGAALVPAVTGTETPGGVDGPGVTTYVAQTAIDPGAPSVDLALNYSAAMPIDAGSLDSPGAVYVVAPDGTRTAATEVLTDAGSDATSRTVTYSYPLADGRLSVADDGVYTVVAEPGVTDADGRPVSVGKVGQFDVEVPATYATLTAATAVVGRHVARGEQNGAARITIENTGVMAFDAAVRMVPSLVLSSTPTGVLGSTVQVAKFAARPMLLRLKPGQSVNTTVRFTYPDGTADGTDYLLASVDDEEGDPLTGVVTTPLASPPIMFTHTYVDLTATAAAPVEAIRPGSHPAVLLRLQNAGNVAAIGRLYVDATLSNAANLAPYDFEPEIAVPAGGRRTIAVPLTIYRYTAAGPYTLVVRVGTELLPDGGAADQLIDLQLSVL